MHNEIFFTQLKRSKKTIFYLLLLVVATAFFVASVNLYQNSITNLKKAEDTYSTLVVTELYGEIDKYGKIVERNSEEHVGYRAVAVDAYDFSEIINSEAVESWDIRTQYGAYIAGHPAIEEYPNSPSGLRFADNVIRFKVKGTEPVIIRQGENMGAVFYPEVIDESSGCIIFNNATFVYTGKWSNQDFWEPYAEQIKKFNGSDDANMLVLQPGVEYIACCTFSNTLQWSNTPGMLEAVVAGNDQVQQPLRFSPTFLPSDHTNFELTYDEDKESIDFLLPYELENPTVPLPIQRWEDVQNDPELKAYFEDAWEDAHIQAYVHNVYTTNDFSSIPAYHIGGVSLKEGRLISEEEYANAAKVCLVSEVVADYQKWEVGDKLPMKLFETPYQSTTFLPPIWDDDDGSVFSHEDEYEIVGIYGSNKISGNSNISANTLDISEYGIFIPEKSVPNIKAPEDRTIHGSTFSVKIKNGSINQFLSDMDAKGITIQQDGQYNPKFTFYDQGYSLVQPGLQSMNSTAKLLLTLSTALLLIVCVLLAYFFWQNQKASVGIFRLLGGTKKNAVIAVLLCALILCCIGTSIGGAIGFGIADVVGSGIMKEQLTISERDMALQAYVLDSNNDNTLAVAKADPLVTLTACGGVLLFPILLLVLIKQDINKEPRELLPQSKK